MEDFSITSSLTTKEYSKIMFVGLYKKPAFILATILGLYMIITIILDYFEIIKYYPDTPLFEIICGPLLLLSPIIITFISVRQFTSNPAFQNDITYSFGESGYIVQGVSFKAEFSWSHIIKQKELQKYLILYHSKRAGNFIDKTKLTAGQLAFIKSKVGKK